MRKHFTMLLLIAGFSIGLSACNTMEGFGEDIQAAGEALEDEAEN